MFKKLFGKKEEVAKEVEGKIVAPVSGEAVAITEVPDPVFAGKMLGDGIAIKPTGKTIYSPVNGTVATVAESLHAYGFEAEEGAEVLIHIGLETVDLNGECFKALVKEGDKVKAGQPVAEVDFDALTAKGYNTITPVIITNFDAVREVKSTLGPVTENQTVVVEYKK